MIRVLLVGDASATRRLRQTLEASGVAVLGEVSSLDDVADEEAQDAVVVIAAAPEQDEANATEPAAPVEPLTPREREVLELVSEGLPNKAIAARLGLSDHTVKFHLSSIFSKLGVRTRTEAVRRAVRGGLINL